MANSQLSIQEGSINFWTSPGGVQFNDGKTTPLAVLNPEGGSIFIVKDDDNYLKVFFVVLGKGREDLEFDAANLDSEQKHMISFTWSVSSGKIALYVDGKLAADRKIDLE